ncbi:rho guanine nucleotide exchange factor 26 isoform X2 [Chanos chanos]|uniref:Rho guanine nucleotide exchange factor 26 isoform X2 n=1 Tax=Chanos chanos TaxID=29144 RepID=A0A6J2X1E3_CHACN|nr:rho guanine nucleotide exchange factor 26 isoform X2 [Chanos chanos]
MDYGNEVDLSNNNNITPLWKRRSGSHVGSRDLRPKPRPLSYQIDGVLKTDFPVNDNCNFTLSQPAEKVVATPTSGNMVLKHILNKPPRKTRVVRSISIGHLSNGRFSLPKFKSESDKHSLGSRSPELSTRPAENGVSQGKQAQDPHKRLSAQVTLTSQSDQIVFGSTPALTDPVSQRQGTPPPQSCNHQLSPPAKPQDVCDSSPAPRPSSSYSSTSSIPSLSSTASTPSDPPTPRTPSPAERGGGDGVVLPRQPSQCSQGSSEGKTMPSIVLSTHSLAALKMGTQQIIPKGLASDTRLTKPATNSPQNLGLGLHLDPSKRALRARSMVESGAFFSTSRDDVDGDCEDSPGTLRRGLRSTSYRRAVVGGMDFDSPLANPKAHRLSQPVFRGVTEDRERSASPSPTKSKMLKGLVTQRTFDSEDDEVLYQNYQEKALHNDSDEDVELREPKPDDRIVVQYKPIRTSWSQLSVVKKSGAAEKLTPEERKRQEAIFEVISSEHSYLHSLEVLIRMFKNSKELNDTMTQTERHHLFSNIVDVCEASKKFFRELEDRHQQNVVIEDISDIVERHAASNFEPYVTYCSNEVYQQRTLQKLVTKNPAFKEALGRIEANPDCRNLPMISFLILPMQRVTRLPLLMDTICQKTVKDSVQYENCKRALQTVSKLVRKCNEGARTMERTEMMFTINKQLEFKIKPFPLVSSSRWMVKRGELTSFVEESGIFSKRTLRQQVYFFLFNDVLIITRKKSEESYTVIDYALRDQIWVGQCQPEELSLSPVRTTAGMLTSRQGGSSPPFRLEFRSNHSREKVCMVLATDLLNERARWISSLDQTKSDKNTDRANMMQVEVTRTYTARQPDELSLQVADVVLVSQTVEDGWYEGERLRDGERGWFLAECAQQITCPATIERNMQRMDRLKGLETNV